MMHVRVQTCTSIYYHTRMYIYIYIYIRTLYV